MEMSDPDRREDGSRELGADEARQAVSDACAAVAKRIAAARSGSVDGKQERRTVEQPGSSSAS